LHCPLYTPLDHTVSHRVFTLDGKWAPFFDAQLTMNSKQEGISSAFVGTSRWSWAASSSRLVMCVSCALSAVPSRQKAYSSTLPLAPHDEQIGQYTNQGPPCILLAYISRPFLPTGVFSLLLPGPLPKFEGELSSHRKPDVALNRRVIWT
jgi:hypothetical protein